MVAAIVTALVWPKEALAHGGGGTPNYTFNASLVSVVEDLANSGLLHKDHWYQWLYKVEVVAGGNTHNALSHFTIELEDCFKDKLLEAIEETAGANGRGHNDDNLSGLEGNEYRKYSIETHEPNWHDPTSYIKWDLKNNSPNGLDEIGDIEYFWFSAPTDEALAHNSIVKYGNHEKITLVDTPACPDCKPNNPVVPEPSTMLLLGSGLAATVVRRKKS